MSHATDVLIIGGGVIGCSIAYQLAKRGVCVRVLEQGKLGAQASGAATGLLAPIKLLARGDDPYLSLQLTSMKLFPHFVRELEDVTGQCVEHHQTGTLRIASPKQEPRLDAWVAHWQEVGYQMQVLRGDEIQRMEPSLSSAYTTAVTIPEEPQVQACLYMDAIIQAARLHGVVFSEGEEVVSIDRVGSRVVGVHTRQGESLTCGHLVIATGAWSARVGEWLRLVLPVSPLQGQSVMIRQPERAIRHILFGEGVYIAPKPQGMLYIGATCDEVGFELQVTEEGITRLVQAASLIVPSLVVSQRECSWAGLRPRTPDHRPILGRVPEWSNVSLACGHNGFGILLSVITGQVLAESIATGADVDILHPYTVERFRPALAA